MSNISDCTSLTSSFLSPLSFPLQGLGKYFPHTWLQSEEFLSRSLLYQVAYLVPAFLVYRVRFYIGWSMAEAACISSGIGAYPVETDPQPGEGFIPSKFVDEKMLNTFRRRLCMSKDDDECQCHFDVHHVMTEGKPTLSFFLISLLLQSQSFEPLFLVHFFSRKGL